MVVTTIPSLALACGVLPLAVGEALGTPVLLAATRRYSTTTQRSMAFSLIYAVMNVGYFAAGWIFDYVRQLNLHVSLFGFEPTSYQQLFMVSLLFEIVLFPVIYFIRRGAEATNGGPVIDESSRDRGRRPAFWASLGETVRKSATDTAHLFQRLISQSAFYRLLAFFLFIGFLKAIFLQMDYVFPKWGIRELGLYAPVGKNFRDQRGHYYLPGPDRRRTHTKVCSISNGGCRWSNLFCRGVHYGATDAMVPGRR
jgi:hypothetical protein